MKKKFASYLMTGKAATTLPFLANNALAQMDLMKEVLSKEEVHIVQVPDKEGKIKLMNHIKDSFPNDEETVCMPESLNRMNVVITGLHSEDLVFLAAAPDKGGFRPDKGGFRGENFPDFKIGGGLEKDFFILSNFVVSGQDLGQIVEEFPYDGGDLSAATYTVSIPIDLNLLTEGDFYLQALVVRGEDFLFSELDLVKRVKGNCYGSY